MSVGCCISGLCAASFLMRPAQETGFPVQEVTMTAASAVSPGRSTSPGSGGSQRNPMVSRAPASGRVALNVIWAVVATGLSAIAGVLAVSLAAGTLSMARIVTLTGVTEVHHG